MWKSTLYSTSRLTTELRDLVESGVNIWAFDYPSFYEGEEKAAFEKKVIDHYYFRQIGQETPGRFLHYFRSRINEIMPYYTRLYASVQLMDSIEDPFGNIDITETFTEESEGSNTGTHSLTGSDTTTANGSTDSTTSGSSNKTVGEDKAQKFSDTPQGTITNLDDHLTNATLEDNIITEDGEESSSQHLTNTNTSNVESSSNGSSSGTTTGKIRRTIHRKGNQGVNTYAHDMKEFREILIDIDRMLINDLNDLFLQVY